MDNSNEPYQAWSLNDMILFNRHVIDEKVVTCQWVDQGTPCNDLVKVRDLRTHLYYRHGITSDSHQYQCLWDACTSQLMMRTSLERHVKEQHIPVKWACPLCEDTFTREKTLTDHIRREHLQLLATEGHPSHVEHPA